MLWDSIDGRYDADTVLAQTWVSHLQMIDADPAEFLGSCDVIDADHPAVVALASEIAANEASVFDVARACFHWVRDNVRHSCDFQLNPVTCRASDVLKHETGFCYAKSHLLAALLRANGIPAGLCYQRLSLDDGGTAFCLHGLNAVHLREFGWYRIDPRGNREGVAAEFDPPNERLAFATVIPGERDLPGIYAKPLEVVTAALRDHQTWQALSDNLPDCA